jgi:hypothetical protein
MQRVATVRALDDFRLAIAFEDGTRGTVSIKERLFGPVFEPLRNQTLFNQVFVDDFGAIAWPNGADLAPDALYLCLRDSAETASQM